MCRFERFLQTKWSSEKRFGLEGLESMQNIFFWDLETNAMRGLKGLESMQKKILRYNAMRVLN